ncbi:uncharacterized protein LOC123482915 isoform X2 [Coregonus clupeaformis]|uniref:uncharacterized protein LOC123482915 isoform X2 n=1 Tax=Coregonus clupeaformis TaxID=59861 RepID=UPI001E1C7071|nr:uncharacterized protein LOC123482915 isoform X2 [Coregonus clupeaformis]
MNTAMTVIVLLVCSDVIYMIQGRAIADPRCRCPKVHAETNSVRINVPLRLSPHLPPLALDQSLSGAGSWKLCHPATPLQACL